jgi:prepilin-type N-terminal cleavage/methylation domain-containing protein
VKRHYRGFTLIEVLAATALSVVILLAVYRAIDWASVAQRTGRDAAVADAIGAFVLRRLSDSVTDSVFHATWHDTETVHHPRNLAKDRLVKTKESGLRGKAESDTRSQLALSGGNQCLVIWATVDGQTNGTVGQTMSGGSSASPGSDDFELHVYHAGDRGLQELPTSIRDITLATARRSAQDQNGLSLTRLRISGTGESGRTGRTGDWYGVDSREFCADVRSLRLRYFEQGAWKDKVSDPTLVTAIDLSVTIIAGPGSFEYHAWSPWQTDRSLR